MIATLPIPVTDCPQVGSGGWHSGRYYEGEPCSWCGARMVPVVPCSNCNGSGFIDAPEICQVCRGTGKDPG